MKPLRKYAAPDLFAVGLAVYALALSCSITLFLAPSDTKYYFANLILLVSLSAILYFKFVLKKEYLIPVLWVLPLILLFLIPVLRYLIISDTQSLIYVTRPILALIPFLVFYFSLKMVPQKWLCPFTITILMLPGLVHLGLMFIDVAKAVALQDAWGALTIQNVILETFEDAPRVLETFKEAPRVGRRHVSIALVQLLFAGALLGMLATEKRIRGIALGIVALALLSLAFLDSRAAYVSLIIGGLVAAIATWRLWRRLNLRVRGPGYLSVVAGIVALAVVLAFVGYVSGKSRWIAATYSAGLAIEDVFRTDIPLDQRAFVDQGAWGTIDDLELCYEERHFRCAVDQSMYLRVAWLFSGIESIARNPLGTGYSPSYMGRSWGVEGVAGKYQRVDNFLIELGVSFGLLAVCLYALQWGQIAFAVHRKLAAAPRTEGIILAIMACLLFTCMARSLVDVWSDGLWAYLFTLLGIFAGVADRQNSAES